MILHGDPHGLTGPVDERTAVSCVGPDVPQLAQPFPQRGQHHFRSVAIVHTGRTDTGGHHGAQGVHEQMTLDPIDFLAFMPVPA